LQPSLASFCMEMWCNYISIQKDAKVGCKDWLGREDQGRMSGGGIPLHACLQGKGHGCGKDPGECGGSRDARRGH